MPGLGIMSMKYTEYFFLICALAIGIAGLIIAVQNKNNNKEIPSTVIIQPQNQKIEPVKRKKSGCGCGGAK